MTLHHVLRTKFTSLRWFHNERAPVSATASRTIWQTAQPDRVQQYSYIFKAASWSLWVRQKVSDLQSLVCTVSLADFLFGNDSERLHCKKAQWLLHLHSGQQRGSSLLAHNVNLALIKASVGTSVDNRKSLFIEKHPVVGLRVDDPSCCGPAERHMVVVVEPHTSSPQFAEQSYIPLT